MSGPVRSRLHTEAIAVIEALTTAISKSRSNSQNCCDNLTPSRASGNLTPVFLQHVRFLATASTLLPLKCRDIYILLNFNCLLLYYNHSIKCEILCNYSFELFITFFNNSPCAFKRCFLILPLPVIGNSSVSPMGKMYAGALCQPSVFLTNSCNDFLDGWFRSSRNLRNAPTTSPYFASAIPTTAAWATFGCSSNLSSISLGAIFSPPKIQYR